MDQFEKKEVVQAILIADNNVENFRPLSDTTSTSLIPLVNVPMLDYALEALNRSGIEEVFVYAGLHLQKVRDYIKQGVESLSTWSLDMTVHVIGGESCRCFGDAMRDLDAKGLIRSNFILLGADTVTNADLRPILEQHKKTAKFDKGAAATLIFKEATSSIPTGNEIMIAVDTQNNRLHHHQRLRMNVKETHFEVPLEVFINNSQVELHHNLIDPQIAVGSPSMLSLFSDNFDFETRDDFVRGILINEEILDSRIYVSLLPREQYARKVNNWLSYQIVSQDVINRWAYPLVPDMGVRCLSQQYVFLKNNIYKSPKAMVSKAALRENAVVQAGSTTGLNTTITCSVIGKNCKIGQNCRLKHAYLMDNVRVGDGCVLEYCVVGSEAEVGSGSELTGGSVVGAGCVLPAKTKLTKSLIQARSPEDDEEELVEVLAPKAYVIDVKDQSIGQAASASDSEDEAEDAPVSVPSIPKMLEIPVTCEESDYSLSSDDEEDSQQLAVSPMPDDTNIFLSEVMDSLARGYQEKSNPDFLVLEINSSRYAYNMSLKEVNFYVVKAIFSMQSIKEPPAGNVLVGVNNVLKQLGPVLANYIKHDDAMADCLKALQEVSEENHHMREKISQVVHYLYDKDYVSEEAIVNWYEGLDAQDDGQLKQSLAKLIEWLSQSSEEEEDDDESD